MKQFLAILFIASIALAGCQPAITGQAAASAPIKIGGIFILTGDGAAWGEASRNGMDLAIADINANGGINGRTLTAVYQDDQGKPAVAINAFRNLVSQDVTVMVGPSWSSTGLPLVDLATEDKVLMISPSLGRKEFNEGSPYLLNTWPHDSELSAQLAEYVYVRGHRSVALIGAEETWVKVQTDAFTKRFTELGGTVVVAVEPAPDTTEVYSDALKIKNAKADVIVSTTDGVQVGARIAKSVRELGDNRMIYSITIDQATIDASQGSYEGLEFLTSLTPTESFSTRYEATYGKSIDIGGDTAYDAVMLIAQAMQETNSTDTTVLAAYLKAMPEYTGESGHLIADGKGAFTKHFVAMRVVNGTAVEI